jgi:hypothetical protein
MAHAFLLREAQIALHEIEDAEDLHRANVDGEVTAPEAAVLARQRVNVRRCTHARIVPAARALVSGDRSAALDFRSRLLHFLGDDSSHQRFIDCDFHGPLS